MNYTIDDLDGQKAFMSRAAGMAAAKGILVVNSAGNAGGDVDWQGKITVPADANGILTVGAVDANGNRTGFSSKGSTADGRVKPDVSAMGLFATVMNTQDTNGVRLSNGTSFSSPIMAGAVASYRQAFPNLTAAQLIDRVKQSGNRAKNPDQLTGWGIPNFGDVPKNSPISDSYEPGKKLLFMKTAVLQGDNITLKAEPDIRGMAAEVRIMDMMGKILYTEKIDKVRRSNTLRFSADQLPLGVYIIRTDLPNTATIKFVKQ